MQSATALLVNVANIYTASATIVVTTSTEALTNTTSGYISVALWVLSASRNWHLLWFAVSSTCRLFHLRVLILLQVTVSLRMWEILLIRIRLETAAHLILRPSIEAVLNVDTLVVSATIRVVIFLHTLSGRGKWMGIDLRIVSTVVGSLSHV